MSKSHEVEYCNLELRFDRRLIRNFIKTLIHEGYSLYWNEGERQFTVSIRTGRKLVKLMFQRVGDRFKIVGDYCFKDDKLVELMEKMIGDTRGHAVVKRFKDRQILIESIMFGEIIRMVEITGMEHKVLYQREPVITDADMKRAIVSQRIEQRIPILRLELDYALLEMYDAMQSEDEQAKANIKQKLEDLYQEMVKLEL
ncbi:MAG: hypothetical protein JWM44_630 [Bacilli bacterium]|nr:hypothetical protein [Bacilli bacterium]